MTKDKNNKIQKDNSNVDTAQLDNVSDRLKYILETLGVKQSHMAQKLGISPAGLHYILNNNVKFSKNAKKMAGILKINAHWLETGEGEVYKENLSIKTYQVPLFKTNDLASYYQSQQKNELNQSGYALTTEQYKNNTIAIINTTNDFEPKFESNDIIIFEETDKFLEGEIILAYIPELKQLTIRKIYHLNDGIILVSNNNATPFQVKPESGIILIGAYRECSKKVTHH